MSRALGDSETHNGLAWCAPPGVPASTGARRTRPFSKARQSNCAGERDGGVSTRGRGGVSLSRAARYPERSAGRTRHAAG